MTTKNIDEEDIELNSQNDNLNRQESEIETSLPAIVVTDTSVKAINLQTDEISREDSPPTESRVDLQHVDTRRKPQSIMEKSEKVSAKFSFSVRGLCFEVDSSLIRYLFCH